MPPTTLTVNQTPCQVRQVRWSHEAQPCDRCQQPADRVAEALRIAVDVDLDGPALLQIAVSVHYCAACAHYFRAQPPFLRPGATYTNRVVTKAVASVYRDGMAITRVSRRLAADFWVRPSASMIRYWCRDHADRLDFSHDYQPWVIGTFSGVLCVDEVYADRLALLLAVDPAAPDGDRLVGYQLVHGASVTQADAADFLARLRRGGVRPDQVITDGSPLYPPAVAAVWPQAAHQLCLFHQTRHVTNAVRAVIKTVRAALPAVPPEVVARHDIPPEPAIAPGDGSPPGTRRRGRGRYRLAVRAEGIAQVQRLRQAGGSIQGIARQVGIARATVRSWLREPARATPSSAATEAAAPVVRLDLVRPPAPPPAPWESWDQVQQVRRAVGVDRFRLLCRPEHLTADDHATFAAVFASPVGEPLRLARTFLADWYAIWRDEHGQRRRLADAQGRYAQWQANRDYAALLPLHKVQRRIDPAQFAQLSHFLRDPAWEGTNNGAERFGRTVRHLDAPRFGWRSAEAIEGALVAHAFQQKDRSEAPPAACRSARGRKPPAAPTAVAA